MSSRVSSPIVSPPLLWLRGSREQARDAEKTTVCPHTRSRAAVDRMSIPPPLVARRDDRRARTGDRGRRGSSRQQSVPGALENLAPTPEVASRLRPEKESLATCQLPMQWHTSDTSQVHIEVADE